MVAILLALLLGIGLGLLQLLPARVAEAASKLSLVGVVVLIGSMGARIGFDPGLMRNLGLFGWQALVLAVCACSGSILIVWVLERLSNAASPGVNKRQMSELAEIVHLESGPEQKNSHVLTYLIIAALLVGIGSGYWFIPHGAGPLLGLVTDWALYVTIWSVGIELGRNKDTLRKVFSLGWRVMLAPLGVVLGSILGAALGGLFVQLPFNEASAVGAGFGWYSLSGVLISQIYSVKLGTIAFLSNVLRELLAVILIPFLAKRVGPLVTVAPGGATSMDTTLPLVATAAGSQTALIGFVSGICLSTLVPFLVPFLIKL